MINRRRNKQTNNENERFNSAGKYSIQPFIGSLLFLPFKREYNNQLSDKGFERNQKTKGRSIKRKYS